MTQSYSAPKITGPHSFESYQEQKHFGNLDGIRFLCIMAVMWHHTPLWKPMLDISVFFSRGHVGVDFFFVLSGYLITTLLLRERSRTGKFSLKRFYWRRMLRIIPIYYLVVSAAGFNEIVLDGEWYELAYLPYYYLFLSNFLIPEHIRLLAPTWSLAVEEQYYLIWPALLLFLPYRWVIPTLAILIGINWISALDGFDLIGIYAFVVGDLIIGVGTGTYAAILMGSLCAVLLHNRRSFELLARFLSGYFTPLLCMALLLISLAVTPAALAGWPNMIVHSLMCLTLMSVILRERNVLSPLLQFAPVRRIGQISYGIYLYHLFAKAIVWEVFLSMGMQNIYTFIAGFVVLSIIMAEISFRTFEAWFMGFRDRGWGRPKPKS
ncbi:acyltransferase family protein [Algirhabdus cladophorae]|uniref:acyltransferase family protein n=1 Tax=Algirhabdus cladophorae TaxID=3377108 RepID=UPI003B84510D